MYEGYSSKGEGYDHLKDILLKVDAITFDGDTIAPLYGKRYQWKSFRCNVTMRFPHEHNGSIVYPLDVRVVLLSYRLLINNHDEIYSNMVDRIYKAAVERMGFQDIFKKDNRIVLVDPQANDSISPPFVLCTKNSCIHMQTICDITDDSYLYDQLLRNYVYAEILRGIAFKMNDNIVEISPDYYLLPNEVVTLYEDGKLD